MAIRFPCSQCGALIEVDDEYAGGQCECPTCRTTVSIPPAAPAPPPKPPPRDKPGPVPHMSPPLETGRMLPPSEAGRKALPAAALVFGILAFCLPPLGLVAILCGIAALIRISHRPTEYGGRGLAIGGIAAGCAGLLLIFVWALVLAIMLPSFSRARELARRSVCATNLKGIGEGCLVYANDNRGYWPMPVGPEGRENWLAGVDYTAAISSYRGLAGDPDAGDPGRLAAPPAKLATTRGFWMLVRQGAASPRSFVCPATTDRANSDPTPQDYWDFGSGDITGPATPAQAKQGWEQVSYGMQVPFGPRGRPAAESDPRMPLAAEKGPFGAALDAGLTAPPPIAADEKSAPDAWRAWNSPNHGGQGSGEGQNVLYADGHVQWSTHPLAGIDRDNLYTQWAAKGAAARQRAQGIAPAPGGQQVPAADTDSLIYP